MRLLGIAALTTAFAVTACDRDAETAAEPEPAAFPSKAEPTSIIRPEIAAPREEEPPPLANLEATVSFAEGGSELSDPAMAALETILASPQMQTAGPIVLRGHTDSVGSDDANLRASRERAEAVRDYLIGEGVAEERIRIVALGEMRPVAPNATLEGEPNEKGRAANRRVDVFIEVPQEEAVPAEAEESATLVEAMPGEE